MFEFNYFNPVRTIFGIGKINVAGEKAAELGKKALLVNYKTPGVLLPLLDRIKGMLGGRTAEEVVFDEVSTGAEPIEVSRGRLRRNARLHGCAFRIFHALHPGFEHADGVCGTRGIGRGDRDHVRAPATFPAGCGLQLRQHLTQIQRSHFRARANHGRLGTENGIAGSA